MSLYEVLGVTNRATQEEIRKAYLTNARSCHPDKNQDEKAKEQFQQLQKAYHVLRCEEKRALYDANGDIDSESEVDGRFGAAPLSEEDIIAFAKEYLGSDVEKDDLIQTYKQCKGHMNKVFTLQILSDRRYDTHRFMDIIDVAIHDKAVKSYKSYERWRGEIQGTPRVNPSFEKRTKKKRKATDSMDELALIAKIKDRGAKHMAFVNDLKSRFIGDQPTPYDDITEEAFQETQSRMLQEAMSEKRRSRRTKARVSGKVKKRHN